jgi:UDP-N-acetylglucosamine 2-epimerase (non-hydrolysing)
MIAVLVGTRPEIIKMAPVMRALRSKKIPFVFIHSNQHYSVEMDQQIIDDLRLPTPDFQLHVGSGTHAVQTGRIMKGVEKICQKIKPSILVVHGDTNTTLGGALTAKKLKIPVGHVEAGLRSHDYQMPEEINRILTDRISDLLFSPTEQAKQNLLKEGIDDKTIIVTGNTVVDALQQHLPLAKKSTIIRKYGLNKTPFLLATAHRPENVDTQECLESLINLLTHAHQKTKFQVVWPIHPRTAQKLAEFHLTLPSSWLLVPPVGYIEMLALTHAAKLIMTDSGGVQEEAYVLQKPLITMRDSTERPETLSANFIIGTDLKKFDKAWTAFQKKQVSWAAAFGKGDAGVKIAQELQNYV